ncbi:MAG TPA: complex I subunit 1 family protein, partial [Fimbriimonadaceae bacterium]|nr:complex I subunit 1 family protein [Fimbriimonadaceae bacterium]
MAQWYLDLHPAWQALIRVLLLVVPILILVPGLIWWERRLLSWMQDRIGPNRVATITWSKTSKLVPPFLRGKKTSIWGLLQPIADGVKLFFKEDITPSAVDRVIYFLAPGIALFPAFALGGTMPWAPWPSLTPVADVNIGVLYMLAISSLGVYGVVLAGYSGNNKYSLMGGLRASAQLISYELAMGMSLACIAVASGSLRMTDMVREQEKALWGVFPVLQNWFVLTPFGFISMVVFLICMVAETNRAPFDLPEAENELIAGYHTEYSSMKFAVFFMGEYAAMFIFSAVMSVIFFGGWNIVPVNWDYIAQNSSLPFFGGIAEVISGLNYWFAPLFFIAKIAFFISVYIWLRATLPRLRYDQLMSLGWKSLLPLATVNFIIVASWILVTRLVSETKNPFWGQIAGIGL